MERYHEATIGAMEQAADRAERGWSPTRFMEIALDDGPDAAVEAHRTEIARGVAEAIPSGTLKLDSRFVETVEVGEIICPVAGTKAPAHPFWLRCADGTERVFDERARGRLFFVPEVV